MKPEELINQLREDRKKLRAALVGIISQACDCGCPEFGTEGKKKHTDECRAAWKVINTTGGSL